MAMYWLRGRPEIRRLPSRSLVVRSQGIAEVAVQYEYELSIQSTICVWYDPRPIWFALQGDWNNTGEQHLRGISVSSWAVTCADLGRRSQVAAE